MGHTATPILHTPWDCRWSRFARRTTAEARRGGLWECVHSGERVAVTEADCESCPFWEYQPANEGVVERTSACARSRAARRIETGIRLTLFITAVIFAATGVVVLTRPLAVPLTISLWFVAATSLMLGTFGNFRTHADGSFRGFLPPRA